MEGVTGEKALVVVREVGSEAAKAEARAEGVLGEEALVVAREVAMEARMEARMEANMEAREAPPAAEKMAHTRAFLATE